MITLPILKGRVAERFIKTSSENLLRKGSIDFSKQLANSKAILEKKKRNTF